jgi:hypothetical protein
MVPDACPAEGVSTGIKPSNEVLWQVLQTNFTLELALRGTYELIHLSSQALVFFVKFPLYCFCVLPVGFHPLKLCLFGKHKVVIVLFDRMPIVVMGGTCYAGPSIFLGARRIRGSSMGMGMRRMRSITRGSGYCIRSSGGLWRRTVRVDALISRGLCKFPPLFAMLILHVFDFFF